VDHRGGKRRVGMAGALKQLFVSETQGPRSDRGRSPIAVGTRL